MMYETGRRSIDLANDRRQDDWRRADERRRDATQSELTLEPTAVAPLRFRLATILRLTPRTT